MNRQRDEEDAVKTKVLDHLTCPNLVDVVDLGVNCHPEGMRKGLAEFVPFAPLWRKKIRESTKLSL